MHKITYFKITSLCHHVYEEGVRGNVEWNAQENIRTALVELTREFAICYVKLKKRMTRRQRHLIDKSNVPSIDDYSSGIRVVLDLVNDLTNLIDRTAIRS